MSPASNTSPLTSIRDPQNASGLPPPVGLSSAEAERQLAEFGRNEIRRERSTAPLTLLARQFASPVIWLLVVAGVLSAALGEVLDAAAIGAIVLVNAVIGFFQEHRAERAVMALRSTSTPARKFRRFSPSSRSLLQSLYSRDGSRT